MGTRGFKGMTEDAAFVFFNLLLERHEHASMHKPTEQTGAGEREKRERGARQ